MGKHYHCYHMKGYAMRTKKTIRCYHNATEMLSCSLDVSHLSDDDINLRLFHLNTDYPSLCHVLCEETLPLREQLKLFINPLFNKTA